MVVTWGHCFLYSGAPVWSFLIFSRCTLYSNKETLKKGESHWWWMPLFRPPALILRLTVLKPWCDTPEILPKLQGALHGHAFHAGPTMRDWWLWIARPEVSLEMNSLEVFVRGNDLRHYFGLNRTQDWLLTQNYFNLRTWIDWSGIYLLVVLYMQIYSGKTDVNKTPNQRKLQI